MNAKRAWMPIFSTTADAHGSTESESRLTGFPETALYCKCERAQRTIIQMNRQAISFYRSPSLYRVENFMNPES
ncbi:MAG: hypothetical protein CSA22_03520 [Deltaproteobacteria bacterium]|nr:MAG: hypothetical protein CSA22_03520 [Deltaproteobacteria bacterium]